MLLKAIKVAKATFSYKSLVTKVLATKVTIHSAKKKKNTGFKDFQRLFVQYLDVLRYSSCLGL